MSLHSGSRLGHFEIGPSLGAGGMGEVYQARDTTLDRDVALKVLPAAFAQDAERVARLEREARLLASLNHPNIAAIYNLEQAGDQRVLVMELVPGPTLAQKLEARGLGPKPPQPQGSTHQPQGLGVDEAIAIGRQIAEGLEAAHAKGIIHRDLKPANIKVTPEGKVKLLDFGLAKAFDAGDGSPAERAMGDRSPLSLSPTMAGATAAGIILGTAAYMSPEQARGKRVDAQTDVWAFGCVLYEMLTARKAFEGDTVTDVLAAVVRAEPDFAGLPSATPEKIRSLVKRCLQKDPTRRLHHIGDARLELEEAGVESPATPTSAAGLAEAGPHVGLRATWTHAIPWALTTVSIIVAIVATRAAWRGDTPVEKPVARVELSLPSGVELYSVNSATVAISPDGSALAFTGVQAATRRAYLRRLDQADTVALRGTELAGTVFFSADSASLGVASTDTSLKKVSLKDGLVVTVGRGIDYSDGAAWEPDGRSVVVRDRTLWRLPATEGTPQQLTTLDTTQHEVGQRWPAVLPGGRGLLFTSYTSGSIDDAHIEAVSSDGKRRIVVQRGAFPVYSPTGHLIFLRDGALLAVPFDVARLEPTGAAVRLVDSVSVSGSGAPLAAVSSTGTLVFAPAGATAGRLVWVSRQGAEQQINNTARNYVNPRVSPDGRRIVVQNGTEDLWLQDTARQVYTRLTPAAANTGYPVWTADGQRVVFRTATGIHWIQVDGSGRGGAIAGTTSQDLPSSVSPDGETLAFLRISPDSSGDVYVLSLRGDPKPRAIVKTAAYEGGPQFSPDGHWLAYASDESGQMQIYVRPYPAPDRKWQVSTDGGSYPRWSRSGKELFYRDVNGMMVVELKTASTDSDPALSPPKLLFDKQYAFAGNTIASYDLSQNGERFVMVKEDSTANRLHVVFNWFEELKRRVPTR